MTHSPYDHEFPDNTADESVDGTIQTESVGENPTENPANNIVNSDELIITSEASDGITLVGNELIQDQVVIGGSQDREAVPMITFRESLLNDSRITPTGKWESIKQTILHSTK